MYVTGGWQKTNARSLYASCFREGCNRESYAALIHASRDQKRVSEASHVRLVEKISHISKTCFWIREVGVVKKGGEDYYVSPDS